MAKHFCMEHSPSLTTSVLKAASVCQDVVSWVLMSSVLYTVRSGVLLDGFLLCQVVLVVINFRGTIEYQMYWWFIQGLVF